MRAPLLPVVGAVGLVAATALLAGCGSDGSSSAAGPTPTVTVTASATATVTATVTATPAPSASPSPSPAAQECPAEGDERIRIVLGDLDCATAAAVVAQVDRGGAKRQDVEGYVCEFGNAMTRPTIFSCTNRAAGVELVVEDS